MSYSSYSIFQLLNILWDAWEEIHAIDALILIDNWRSYILQRRNYFQIVVEVPDVLREKWSSQLPPLLPLLICFQNLKLIYNPTVHNRRS